MPSVRRSRVRAWVAAVAVSAPFAFAALGVIGPRVADAKDDPVNIAWTAKLDPARVAPGEKGVLVLSGAVRKTVHVFADNRFKVKPTEVAGVTYGFVEKSKPIKWKDPEDPDTESDVWFDAIEVRIPFTLAKDAKLPLTVSATLQWACCDTETCFQPTSTKPPIGAEVKAPETKDGEKPPQKEPPPEPSPAPPEGGSAAGTASPPPAVGPAGMSSEGGAPPAVAAPAPAPAPAPGAPAARPATFRVSTTLKTDEVTLTVAADEKQFVVTFAPAAGHHLYPLGASEGTPVAVSGVTQGVTWSSATSPSIVEGEIHDPYEVRLPYADSGATPLAIDVSWQACLDTGICHAPEAPRRFTLERGATPAIVAANATEPTSAAPPPTVAAASGAGVPLPPTTGASAPSTASSTPAGARRTAPSRGVLFSVKGAREKGWIDRVLDNSAPIALMLLFLGGIGLAFTPCVLPIIPITVSLVGGGRADIKKGRISFLLSCYVLGLSLAFGSMGLAAAKLGASMSAAFQSPVGIFAISGIFLLLSLGMFGVFELQLPAWAQRIQGGAKGGSPVGAFVFGAISALLASPCTGPVIAGLVVFTAQSGNALYGFLMFFTLGLGMGAVFFAAGSLNMLAKPGPWMVWVRYVFGVLLIAIALFYLRSSGRIGTNGVLAIGFAMAVIVALGIGWHLTKKEGEDRHAAYARGVKVALVVVLATGGVALLTLEPGHSSGSAALALAKGADKADREITWTSIRSREQLVDEVEAARARGRATVVDVWAQWCAYCKRYDRVIEENAAVKDGFLKLHRLRMDLTDEDRPWEPGLREGLDIPPSTQPYMVFIDSDGQIRRDLDVVEWMHDEAASKLEERLGKLLGAPEAASTAER